MVYLANEWGLHAVDAATGQERWRSVGGAGAPIAVNGVVYLQGDGAEVVHAFDSKTGAERRQVALDVPASRLAVTEGAVYVVDREERLSSIEVP